MTVVWASSTPPPASRPNTRAAPPPLRRSLYFLRNQGLVRDRPPSTHATPILLYIANCRRPSAVVNLNCVANRVAPGSRYKLSYGAEQYKTIHTLLNIPYLQPPHPTVRHHSLYLGKHVAQCRFGLLTYERKIYLTQLNSFGRLQSKSGQHNVARWTQSLR
jgi:hypothetical protein